MSGRSRQVVQHRNCDRGGRIGGDHPTARSLVLKCGAVEAACEEAPHMGSYWLHEVDDIFFI